LLSTVSLILAHSTIRSRFLMMQLELVELDWKAHLMKPWVTAMVAD
jgi:hypothetical protein